MAQPVHYCHYAYPLEPDNVHKIYHDFHYGRPLFSDSELFELLILEINQAGLSWNVVLTKREHFKRAYDHFNIDVVAHYQEEDLERLLADKGIIRNRLKIQAAVHNAKVVLQLIEAHGSFKNWLDHHHPLTHKEWTQLFKNTFKFTGPEIVKEFLMSSGYLEGAHLADCPIYKQILSQNPAWTQV